MTLVEAKAMILDVLANPDEYTLPDRLAVLLCEEVNRAALPAIEDTRYSYADDGDPDELESEL